MVSVLKQSHEQVYRLYCKSLSNFRQRMFVRNKEHQNQHGLVSQADECLELDANLKMLKNYQRKQIRDFNGKRFFKDRRVAVLSKESRAMNGQAIKAFKLASAILEYTRLEPRAGAIDRRLFKAWNHWK